MILLYGICSFEIIPHDLEYDTTRHLHNASFCWPCWFSKIFIIWTTFFSIKIRASGDGGVDFRYF